MAVFDPPIRANLAWKLPVEYGLFMDAFSRVSFVDGPLTSRVSV
jgi:hypothetical protein